MESIFVAYQHGLLALDWPPASGFFHDLFDWVSRLCRGGDGTLFCYRCMGVWAGAALAFPAAFFAGRRIPLGLRCLLILAFLQMPIVGYGKVPLPDWAKTLSGQAFALSAIMGLTLGPSRQWVKPKSTKTATLPLIIVGLGGMVILQILIRVNSLETTVTKDLLCLLGILVSAMVASLAFLCFFRHNPKRSE